VVGSIALWLLLAPVLKADNALGLSDPAKTGSSKPAANKPSWLPFNLFEPNSPATPSVSAGSVAPAKAKGPSIMDRVGASFAKMNADTKRMMTKTATGLGLKKKPAPPQSPFGNVGQYSNTNSPKPTKKPSGFSSLFVKPVAKPSNTMDDFFKQPRPGEESGF
jgi:hypothetical protein